MGKDMVTNDVLYEQLSGRLERQEIWFQYWLSLVGTWGLVVLPLIPASLTLMAIVSIYPGALHIHPGLAWVIGLFAAVGIEVLGLGAIKLALRMGKYNKRAAVAGVDLAPVAQGWLVAGLYLVVVVLVTVLLKINADWAIYSLLPLALMGFLADWYFALKQDHEERETQLRRLLTESDEATALREALAKVNAQLADMVSLTTYTAVLDERDRLLTEVSRLAAVVERALSAAAPAPVAKASDKPTDMALTEDEPAPADDKKRLSPSERRTALLWRLREVVTPDDIDYGALAAEFGTSDRTIRRDIEALVSEGRLVVNGVVTVVG